MRTFPLLTLVLVGTACASSRAAPGAAEPTATIVLASEVEWKQLNPARGDQSPKAAPLWGDRHGPGPSGFLVRFVDGFSSPPHIHNVFYRGVVIEGLIHNDDPNAEAMWMPTGSFWTQPSGGAHITAAKGGTTVAYIETEEGPYLVRPAEEAFQSQARPMNVDASNIVWVDASAGGARVAFLWGDPQDDRPGGILVKLPAGSAGTVRSHGSTLHAVVIHGRPEYREPGKTGTTTMEPGSYLGSNGRSAHQISCDSGEDCILYVRTEGKVDVGVR